MRRAWSKHRVNIRASFYKNSISKQSEQKAVQQNKMLMSEEGPQLPAHLCCVIRACVSSLP